MYQLVELKDRLTECLDILEMENKNYQKTILTINHYIFFLEELINYTNYEVITESYVEELNEILNLINQIYKDSEFEINLL